MMDMKCAALESSGLAKVSTVPIVGETVITPSNTIIVTCSVHSGTFLYSICIMCVPLAALLHTVEPGDTVSGGIPYGK